MALYDDIGRTYTATRRSDPRIAARINAELGDARSVINIGAGTAADLDSGRCHDRHADLLDLDELDLGYCLVCGRTN
jgi:hypothetical protein